MKEELDSQSKTIEETIDVFKNIIEAIEDIVPKIQNVNSSAYSINEEKMKFYLRWKEAQLFQKKYLPLQKK